VDDYLFKVILLLFPLQVLKVVVTRLIKGEKLVEGRDGKMFKVVGLQIKS
jgi:hypothetical protein